MSDEPKQIPPHEFEPYNVPSKPVLSDYCQRSAKTRNEHVPLGTEKS